MTTITIVRNDVNFLLEFTILDADGTAVNLVGVSDLSLKYKPKTGTGTTTITGVVKSAVDGTCTFDVGTHFQNILGKYKAEIQITYGTGKVITAPHLTIIVIEDL